MERVEMLNRGGASILEKLNEMPTSYVKFCDLLEVKKSPPKLTWNIHQLEKVGYVERSKEGTKITEKGQEALSKYKVIEEIVAQFP